MLLANGKTTTKKIDGLSVLSTMLDADLNPGLAAELPATMHAARHGNTQPLLRLVRFHDLTNASPAEDLSTGLYAATVCRDGPFPWAPETPVAQRQGILTSAVAALPAGNFGPFGRWAYRFGNADFCVGWPSPSGGAALGPGPPPNVPVLAVSGGFDMRTPTEGATAVVSRFPQGRLLVVPGIGHSTVTADPMWIRHPGGQALDERRLAPSQCPRPTAIVSTIPALPAGKAPKSPWGAQATYSIASKTVAEAEAAWLMAQGPAVPGIFGGKLAAGRRDLTLTRYAISPWTRDRHPAGDEHRPPAEVQGTLTVAGRRPQAASSA